MICARVVIWIFWDGETAGIAAVNEPVSVSLFYIYIYFTMFVYMTSFKIFPTGLGPRFIHGSSKVSLEPLDSQ